jgi:hypothetical protein
MVISTVGAASVPSASGQLTIAAENLIGFSGNLFGEATRGNWSLFFDGSGSGFDTSDENINALTFRPGLNGMEISTVGSYHLLADFSGDADAWCAAA